MRKATLLFLCGVMALASCTPDSPSGKDGSLEGTEVSVADFPLSSGKLFVLNEGQMGTNNATLDFLSIPEGKYVRNTFEAMNPDAGRLGDVGNDIAVRGSEVWMVVNNSGLVEVVSAKDETEIASISVPTPRNIAFDGKYAYVTSWAGAYADYDYDSSGNRSLSSYENPKGRVYRIDIDRKKVDGSVEVGYQPEGIACYKGKLYVANSGGVASQLPPSYSYDKTISIIDTKTFKVTGSFDVRVNLKGVFSDGKGIIYITSLGNFSNEHSGLFAYDVSEGTLCHISDYVSAAALSGSTVHWIGTETEFDWGAQHVYKTCYYDGIPGKGTVKTSDIATGSSTPFSLAVFGKGKDAVYIIGDAGDYVNPGTLSCYAGGKRVWSVLAGVCPGHFAYWGK